MSDENAIVRYVIHPGIGIARVGNSRETLSSGQLEPVGASTGLPSKMN